MKIIDCFTFYNELKMLEFRLAELNDDVDYFVLVESTFTFTGNKKDLFFDKNKNLYSKYLHKIIHIIVDDVPNTENAWDNETHQRNCIDRGIEQLTLNDDDIIFISDVDEVQDTETIQKIKNKRIIVDGLYNLEQFMYYYNITIRNKEFWYYAKVVNYHQYCKKYNHECGEMRFAKLRRRKYIPNGGWHLSYFMNEEEIANKIKNFSHQEFNKDEFTDVEYIKHKIESGTDLFGRGIEHWKKIKIEENDYLPKKYKMLLNW